MVQTAFRVAAFCALSALLSLGSAAAQTAEQAGKRQNEPGQFDFYVLSLSWSPSFCDAGGDRAKQQPECGERPYSFIVHGLWPQYDKGFPEFCQVPAPRLDRNIVSSMLDLMPAPRLIFHEWDRHGTCSGMPPRAYFETIRKARAVVKIPSEYVDVKTELTVTPDEVEQAFIKVNPGLPKDAIAIGCDNRRLREIRVCMSKELAFRSCKEIEQRSCRRDKLVMPPVRGG
ncbi:MAG TPA: ribonuclease T2 [Xanthobacteraceae bacterium]|jgi:ribonuclease T2|nr:ribonuclease T2 [Xanthobacteraceae bacterium]